MIHQIDWSGDAALTMSEAVSTAFSLPDGELYEFHSAPCRK
jgi:hypothetical protein